MNKKPFVPTLKAFSLAAAGALVVAAAALFASCDNMGGDVGNALLLPIEQKGSGGTGGAQNGTTQGRRDVLTASVAISNLPALPAAAQSGASDVSKSAFPGVEQLQNAQYTLSATLKSAEAGGATYTANGTYDSASETFSFGFAGALSASDQNYTLKINLYYTDPSAAPAGKSLVASGEQSVTVAAGEQDFSASVQLLPNEDSTVNGSLELPIKFSDATVTSVSVQLIDKNDDDVAAAYIKDLDTSATPATLSISGGAGTIASVAGGLPPGTYTLLMSFVKGSATVGSRTETLNVFPSLKTSAWWTNSGSAEATLSVTKFDQKEFWVKGTGGGFYTTVFPTAAEAQDTNNGSFAFPLKTIQEAVDRIKAAGNATTQYTIYIDGTVTVPADADYSTITDDYKKSLVYINSEQKITITGWTGSGIDIIDCGKKCRAITAASGAEVAITKLAIKNGDAVNYGGALYVGGGASTVILGDGALVNGNHCETNGGAIYCNGNLYICGSAVVGDYSPSMTAALEDDCGNSCDGSGGGISCSGNLYLGYSGKNSSGGLIEKALSGGIYRNYSKTYGGGIYSTGTVTMASGSVDFNAAASSGGRGGGVDVASGGIFEMSGSARISGNKSSKDGGGVWVSSSGKFSMSDSSRVSGNSATTNGGGIYSEGESLMGGSSQVCGNTANYGGGVYISAGCFCMSGSAIVGAAPTGLTEAAQADDAKHSNKATNDGGGIFTYTPSRLKLGYKNETTPDPTFSGGIYYNYANNGGGIYASGTASTATLEIERGSVCYNGAANDGGGILGYGLSGDSILKITGGQISYNSAKDGGGLCANRVYVGGGKIAGNTASDYGGGVYAGRDFYLYGTGVIGDPNKAQIATESDCSNKAKAGGGVFAHHAYIGYSDASTPAACTGGIYRNYATAVKGSETYFYSGGGICVVGMAANWLFKMQSGTVAYNAGDSSDGYGGGLFIYGSGMIDSSIAYPQVTGGSFVGNGAKYGGALCCYSNTFAVGGSVYMPSATGEKGDNDIYINNDLCRLHLASPFDAATPTPVLTATPSAYSPGKNIFDTSIGSECSKIGVASNDDSIPWAVGNDGKLVKDCAIVYVASTSATPNPGDDDFGDGSEQHPYATIRKAASMFSDKTAVPGGTEYNPLFKNKVYVLSDITFGEGAGATGDCNFEVVGCAGGVEGSPVTLTFNTASGSGFYVAPGQKVKLTDINITQSSGTNEYAALMAAVGGELFLEDCSITGMRAKKCSAIAAEGPVHLKNVSVKNNVAIAPEDGGYVWGPAVFSKQGKISLLGKVEITGNMMEIPGAQKEQNVWIGDNKDATVYYEPLVIVGKLDSGSQIGVTTYDISKTVFTIGYKAAGNTAEPSDYFTSDSGMGVEWNSTSEEAELKIPTTIYVRGTNASPAGSDTAGNGTSEKAYATLQKALDVLDSYGVATNQYKIEIIGTAKGKSTIKSDINAAKITLHGYSYPSGMLDGLDKSGSVLTINAAIPVDIKSLTITNGTRGVDIEAAATVTITDCIITENDATGGANVAGAGIYVPENTSIKTLVLTITGSQIRDNTATGLGGGIHFGAGTLLMENVKVNGNKATITSGQGKSGGGLYVGGTNGYVNGFTMTGGQISGNTSQTDGGGISVNCKQAANCLLDGVTISGNTATTGNGGGIAITSQKYLSVKDCAISGNASSAGSGGGIYNAGTCYISGDTVISANTAAANGGGVFSNKTLTFSDGVSIPVGTGTSKNDVYLEKPITISGTLTATAPVATITPSAYETATQVLGGTAALIEASREKFNVTPNGTEIWTIDENGYLKTGGGSGTITFDTPEGKLTLSASATTIATSASDTTITITAKNASGTAISSGLTSWGISIYYGTDEIATATTNSYKFLKSFPKGTYRMVVSVTYSGATYSDTFVITKTVD